MQYRRIVLNIPHSSCFMWNYDKWEDMEKLAENVKKWTDWHTDKLFAPVGILGVQVKTISFPYSRFYVDVERLKNDEMEKIGQGIIYTEFEGNKRKVRQKRHLMSVYNAYINSFHRYMDTDGCLLIDCHSFPSSFVDDNTSVCIGFNEDESRPSEEILELVWGIFENEGYKVAFNHPFSNSLTPIKPIKYHSLMIEINKKVYMNENTLELLPTSYKIMNAIQKVYRSLLPEKVHGKYPQN